MTLSVALLLGLAGLLLLLYVTILLRRASRPRAPLVPNGRARAAASPPDGPTERLASAASEAIERLTNEALAKGGLPGTKVDFATAHDGSLEIWIGDERYTSVDAIPDPRVRQAVADAVASFNR